MSLLPPHVAIAADAVAVAAQQLIHDKVKKLLPDALPGEKLAAMMVAAIAIYHAGRATAEKNSSPEVRELWSMLDAAISGKRENLQ